MSDSQVTSSYSVQNEAANVLREGILRNPRFGNLPSEVVNNLHHIQYTGSPKPSIPVNWRVAEGVAALMGLEALMINTLLIRKYGLDPVDIEINTDHASLYVMGLQLVDVVDANGQPIGANTRSKRVEEVFRSKDFYRARATPHRAAATNLYRTKDGRYYDVHGSLNPDITIQALGLPLDRETIDYDDAVAPYIEKVAQFDSGELDNLMNNLHFQSGTICYTTEEYAASEHGRANAHVGLYEIETIPYPNQPPAWWSATASPQTSARRPLAGLRVVDLTRIIAGPSISKGLAELGASVMRITAGHIPDMSVLHVDLNWGKWNAELDLRTLKAREKLRALILDADVVLDGYRPGVMARFGFGKDDVLALCKDRERGIIYARENCYGWHGPWKERSGWQQVSDACCGVSMEFGRAMGNDEPVTQFFPTSDYCTGLAGVSGILHAILERGRNGGSYVVQTALNYFSRWFIDSCGVYPPAVWDELWGLHGRPVIRHYQTAAFALPRIMKSLNENSGDVLFRPGFFEIRHSQAAGGRHFKVVRPVIRFPNGEVMLGFNVGTRSNGVDKPRWPEDGLTEIVD